MPLSARLPALRAHMVDALYPVLMIAGGLLVGGNVLRALSTGWKPLYAVYLLFYACVVLIWLLRARVPLWLREGYAVGVMLVGGAAGFTQFGPVGNTNPVFLGVIFIAAALYGLRIGIFVTLGCVFVLASISVAVHVGDRLPPIDVSAFLANPTSWVAAAATVVAIGSMLVLQASRLLEWFADYILAGREAERVLAEQVRAHERVAIDLRRSEQLFTSAFRASPDWISLHRLEDGSFLEVNPAFERLTGYAHDAVIGRDPGELSIWQRPGAWSALRDACTGENPPRDLPVEVRSAEGRQCELLFSASRTEAGGAWAILVVARDVTERNRARRGRDALRAELERRVGERTEALQAARVDLEGFVASASRDLRAPLQVIEAEERALREALAGRLDGEAAGLLGRLGRASEQAARLVDSLIELARINRREPLRERVDLGAMARELLARLAREAPGRSVEVEIADDLVATGDPALLRAALEQLLANAWKFTAAAATPRIEVAHGARPGEFVVRDNGSGFDMAYASKLFRPFERLHAPGAYAGLGIGLALAASAIHRHGGSISAESAPGRGAVFRFALDAGPPAAAARPA